MNIKEAIDSEPTKAMRWTNDGWIISTANGPKGPVLFFRNLTEYPTWKNGLCLKAKIGWYYGKLGDQVGIGPFSTMKDAITGFLNEGES